MGSGLRAAQRKVGNGASEGTNLEEPSSPIHIGGSDEPKDEVELHHI